MFCKVEKVLQMHERTKDTDTYWTLFAELSAFSQQQPNHTYSAESKAISRGV